MAARYCSSSLIQFATELLVHTGLDPDKSDAVARILVEADLLGHTTHGLQLLGPYLADLEKGTMAKTGSPRVIADFPAAVTWDGMRLPGPWLTEEAIKLAMRRARTTGTCTVVIRRSHHIACLAAYLRPVAEAGMMILLSCSDPVGAWVPPHGGRAPVLTPDPIAAAWPTTGDPVMLDISMSITSHGTVTRCRNEGRTLPGLWLIDHNGNPTNDPNVLFAKPPGAILPIGGIDHGHKGYALMLMIEAMTNSLAGHGRADPTEGWTASTFVQIFDPALFGGTEAFVRQSSWLAEACRNTPPRAGVDRVRLPGESGLRRRETQLEHGVELYPGIMSGLQSWAAKYKVKVADAVTDSTVRRHEANPSSTQP